MQPQTQGKLFIIGGAIGLLISGYFLVTAFFPKSPTNTADNQNPTAQETQDNEDEEVDFTDILIQGQEKMTIHVLIPEFLFTNGFQAIATQIKEDLEFDIQFHTPIDNTFLATLGDDWVYEGTPMDIVLFPTDIIESFIPQARHITAAETIKPYYNTAFDLLLDKEEYTFIPHIIDPLVIYTKTNINPPQNIQDRLTKILARESPKRGHFPILFGLSHQDKHFIKQNREVIEDNFFLLYHIISHIATGTNGVENIRTLLDIPNLLRSESWNVADFISTTNKFAQENRHCKTYPSICLFNYNFGDIRFGLLSDVQKIEKYFSIRDYRIHPFREGANYPARGWGFLIHQRTTSNTRVLHFLEAYIQASLVEIEENLRDRTIAASLIADNTIQNSGSGAAFDSQKTRNILIRDMQFFQTFDTKTSFIETREGAQTPELFIEKINN